MPTSVKIIADSLSPFSDVRITSFEVIYPRFILPEVNTHRMIAKSSASSRAIPLQKRINDVKTDPFVPLAFTKNKPGMVADEVITDQYSAMDCWLQAREEAVYAAERLLKLDVHKQHAARLLEPFMWQRSILTATDWKNFFKLRTASNAQPEFQELANLMKEAYDSSVPSVSPFHLPYVDSKMFREDRVKKCMLVSAARCARVSYNNHDGSPTTVEKDLELAESLIKDGHMSPFDHPARATYEDEKAQYYRHLYRWLPLRELYDTREYDAN